MADAGDPRNAPARQVHNFLTRDGTPAAEIYAAGRGEATGYGGEVCAARVTAPSSPRCEGSKSQQNVPRRGSDLLNPRAVLVQQP